MINTLILSVHWQATVEIGVRTVFEFIWIALTIKVEMVTSIKREKYSVAETLLPVIILDRFKKVIQDEKQALCGVLYHFIFSSLVHSSGF